MRVPATAACPALGKAATSITPPPSAAALSFCKTARSAQRPATTVKLSFETWPAAGPSVCYTCSSTCIIVCALWAGQAGKHAFLQHTSCSDGFLVARQTGAACAGGVGCSVGDAAVAAGATCHWVVLPGRANIAGPCQGGNNHAQVGRHYFRQHHVQMQLHRRKPTALLLCTYNMKCAFSSMVCCPDRLTSWYIGHLARSACRSVHHADNLCNGAAQACLGPCMYVQIHAGMRGKR